MEGITRQHDELLTVVCANIEALNRDRDYLPVVRRLETALDAITTAAMRCDDLGIMKAVAAAWSALLEWQKGRIQ